MWSDLNLSHNYRQTQSDKNNNTRKVVPLQVPCPVNKDTQSLVTNKYVFLKKDWLVYHALIPKALF